MFKSPKMPQFSMGWEFEAIKAAVITPKGVLRGTDGSVAGEGIEYRLSPDLVNNPYAGIMTLKKLLSLRRLEIDDTCGFHVHIGLGEGIHSMADDVVQTWAAWCVALAKEVESRAFEAVPRSRIDNRNCKRWKGVLIQDGIKGQSYHESKYSNPHRYQWLNITEVFRRYGIRTIENRLCGNSRDFPYLVTWIVVTLRMAQAAFRLLADPSRLDYEAQELIEYFDCTRSILAGSDYADKRVLRSVLHNSGIFRADGEHMNHKELEIVIDKQSPAVNTSEDEDDFRMKFHRPQTSTQELVMTQYGYFDPHCGCNSCNYFKYEKKLEMKQKRVAKKKAKLMNAVAESATSSHETTDYLELAREYLYHDQASMVRGIVAAGALTAADLRRQTEVMAMGRRAQNAELSGAEWVSAGIQRGDLPSVGEDFESRPF